jgi:hypothetical protein
MLAEMTAPELREWQEYYDLEPFGEERADLRMGILASLIANVNRSSKSSKTYTAKDFMPRFGREKATAESVIADAQDVEYQKLMAQKMAALFGRNVLNGSVNRDSGVEADSGLGRLDQGPGPGGEPLAAIRLAGG